MRPSSALSCAAGRLPVAMAHTVKTVGRTRISAGSASSSSGEQISAARTLKPIYERQGVGRSVLLFDRADRQQLAAFGEGRTPEAYVPLPDGRTIPVSMTGNGKGDTVVKHETHIYDQSGHGVNITTNNRMDGKTYVQEIFINDLMQEGPIAQAQRSYFGAR